MAPVNVVTPVTEVAPVIVVAPVILVAPVIVAPLLPVNNPFEVIVPPAVVEILPLVVTASPRVVGERVEVKLLRSQNPIVPEVGGVEVNFFDGSVYTPELAFNPLKVSPVNVGDEIRAISCGVDRVMLPDPLVTITWLDVPVNVVLVRVLPVVFPIRSSPLT